MKTSLREDILKRMEELEQHQIVAAAKGMKEAEIEALAKQVETLEQVYPGGLSAYRQSCLRLLNTGLDGQREFKIEVPDGTSVSPGSEDHIALEKLGEQEFGKTCFVLVAGGMGERLGYSGIKVSIPVDLVSGKSYLEYYCLFIQEYQRKAGGVKLPFCIMTSDQTDAKTKAFFKENNFFGLDESQVHVVKQGKIPTVVNKKAEFGFDGKLIDQKPHGHGDVHALLHQSGLAKQWEEEGKKYLVIFQDTNLLAFRSIPAALGLTVSQDNAMTFVTVPRKPGEAVGAITKYLYGDGTSMTCNTEYNVLKDYLIKFYKDGEDKPQSGGNSAFPGNTGTYIFNLSPYNRQLVSSQGIMPEFINPKYKENSEEFKSPARLECMAQDFAKLFSKGEKVGYISFPRWFCFSPCKNDIATGSSKATGGLFADTAFSAESDMFRWNKWAFERAGGSLTGKPDQIQLHTGAIVDFTCKIVLLPSFGVIVEDFKDFKKSFDSKEFVILGGTEGIKEVKMQSNTALSALKAGKGQEFEQIRGYCLDI